MDNNRNKIKVDEILGSLDNHPKVAAPNFFYTRLKAKMEKNISSSSTSWILRPAYAIVALVLVLAVNATVLLNTEISTENTTTTAEKETDQSISAEYSFTDNSMYDLNQER